MKRDDELFRVRPLDERLPSKGSDPRPRTTGRSRDIGPVEAFWRFRSWTVPITIVIGMLAGLAALATSGTSTATTTLYLTDPRGAPVFRDGSSSPADLARYARQRAEFAQSANVLNQVVTDLDELRAGDPSIPAADVDRARRNRRRIDDIVIRRPGRLHDDRPRAGAACLQPRRRDLRRHGQRRHSGPCADPDRRAARRTRPDHRRCRLAAEFDR